MTTIVSTTGNQVQCIKACLARLDNIIAAYIGRVTTPATIRTVVPRIHQTTFGDQHIIRISKTGRIYLHRACCCQDRLVLPFVTTKRIVVIVDTGSIFIIKCWQVVGCVANGQQINFQYCRTQCILWQFGKVVGWRTLVSVAAHGNVELAVILGQCNTISGMVFFRTWQSANQVHFLPSILRQCQSRQNARVCIEVGAEATATAANAWIT